MMRPMRDRPLGRSFFAGETLEVAERLLGCTLAFGRCRGIIVETEAYKTDAASHFMMRRHQGRALADSWGEIYIYLNYGMYYLLNVTTESEGVGAVLIRAVEPTHGLEAMMRRRGTRDRRALASGPGRLTVAFGITGRQNGEPAGRSIRFYDRPSAPPVSRGPRVGIRRDAHLPWRFVVEGSEYASRGPRAPRAAGRR